MALFTLKKKRTWSAVICLSFVLLPACIYAQMMQSTQYKIQTDSINTGGLNSSSASYSLSDTVGEIGTGTSTGTVYTVNAGYWQMQESYIALSSPPDLVLSNMNGIGGGVSEGTILWTVITDNPAGYSMKIQTTTSPALQSTYDSYSDYVPSGAVPDYTYTNAPANSSFGFSPEGNDVDSRYKDNGLVCGTGALETVGKCWDGLSTSQKAIAVRPTSNHPTGTDTTLRVRAESGSSHLQRAGTYSTQLVVTAVSL